MQASCARTRAALLLLTLLLWPSLEGTAQSVSVAAAGGALRIHAPDFHFLKGQPLARLKDGRAVRLELAAMILPDAGKSPIAAARRIFSLSYDLWEERFAVATVESRSRRVSHLTSAAAEAWCLEQLSFPLDALGALGPDTSFWVRLEYRILDGDGATTADDDASLFTLQALIDVLSRRRDTGLPGETIEAGPFRLPRSGRISSYPVVPP